MMFDTQIKIYNFSVFLGRFFFFFFFFFFCSLNIIVVLAPGRERFSAKYSQLPLTFTE